MRIYYLFILLTFLTTPWAATVSGYIKDSITGKAIPNANITIRETELGIASNPYGHYEINLPIGTYILET